MNRLAEELARSCRDSLLEEKWLIAPNLRVGHQWLEAVARGGQASINVRVKTIKSLALELASGAMAGAGLKLLDDLGGEVVLDRALAGLADEGIEYLAPSRDAPGLAGALYRTGQDLRLGGVGLDGAPDDAFEVRAKGRALLSVVGAFEGSMQGRFIDYPGALALAIGRVQACGPTAPGALLLIPSDAAFRGAERDLIDAFPEVRRVVLAVDEPARPGDPPTPSETDAGLLRWLFAAAEAPPPVGDGSARIYRAIGERNEVREVLRRCLEAEHPLDTVELLHTDAEAYVPAVYEALLAVHEGEPGDGLPVTFAEGISCRYARPGRALAAWAAWVREGFPQTGLERMLREGLLLVPEAEEGEGGVFADELADGLRGLGIGRGRSRYLARIDERIERRDRPPTGEADPDAGPDRRPRALRALRELVAGLLDEAPPPGAPAVTILEAGLNLLEGRCRLANKLDREGRVVLTRRIVELKGWLGEDDRPTGLDPMAWLETLPDEARVLGSNPRPGCLHVANALEGGHSGRSRTFLLGLDEGRFPGPEGQDPLLLDAERRRLSPGLATAEGRLADRRLAFARLLARLRGEVTLAFPCHDLLDDRERHPGPALLAAYRLIAGDREGDQGAMMAWLPRAASFAPESEARCLDESEWWLWRLHAPRPSTEIRALVGPHYPNLDRGLAATEARLGPLFTPFDGRVEEAGPDLDPTTEGGPRVSPSRLEILGRCPMAFFLQYGLRLSKSQAEEADPDHWLDQPAFGKLLHQILARFLRERIDAVAPPHGLVDLPRLLEIVDDLARRARDDSPSPSEAAFGRQVAQLARAARVFLVEEAEAFARLAVRPAYLEASLGIDPGEDPSPLDSAEPIILRLPDGSTLRVGGRIDRIDRLGDGPGPVYAIVDYKSGSTYGHDLADPFGQGRKLQHLLYAKVAEARLREISGEEATIAHFEYFFPGEKGRGDRVRWAMADLEPGRALLTTLVEMIRHGAFLPTDDPDDCTYCDYKAACGDSKTIAAASTLKLDDERNTPLGPFRGLRRDATPTD